MSDESTSWHHCSICKKPLAFTANYFVCSVSTCRRKRNPLYFCSLACWEAHLPMMRHRDAWAEQERAPTLAQWQAERATAEAEEGGTPTVPDALRVEPPTAGPVVSEVPTSRRRVVQERPPVSEPVLRHPVAVIGVPHQVTVEEAADEELPQDVLVVVSKLKAYVKARSGMSTSDGVVDVLSDHLRRLCVEAIRNAARDGRRTVMDRDFKPLV